MTDARLPERWLNDRRLQRLSADHFRSFVNCLLYAVANRTDGQIERADLALIPHWAANAAQAFVDAGLFLPRSEGWLIADYGTTQSSRDELDTLERIRAADRQRKRQKRAVVADTPTDVSPDSPTDTSAGTSSGQSGGTAQAGRKAGRQAGPEGDGSNVLPMKPAVNEPVWRGAGPDPYQEYR